MDGKHDYRTAVPRKPISFPGKLRMRKAASGAGKPVSAGAYVKLVDREQQEQAGDDENGGACRRRGAAGGVRAFRLGGRRVRAVSWRLRPRFRFLSLRLVSPTFLLRKLKQAYLNLMRVEGRIDLVDGDRVCVTYTKAYMAYVRRTAAEGRFYRNGVPILDLKKL